MASFTKVFSCICLILLWGCSGMEQSEQDKLRRLNAKGEFIHRTHAECRYPLQTPIHKVRDKYPWESSYVGKHAKITKEYFRCKGSSLHPPHSDHKDPARPANYFDCGGPQKHSLPIVEDREFIYPILIDLLNYIQAETDSKVVITCGHRCPNHNVYADSSSYNSNSKHMIGAEVDFYVQGMEQKPEEVVRLIMKYYSEMPEYQKFERLDAKGLNVATPPWFNKEVLIKLYKKGEGRDFDNRHPYPYLSIQVRFDRERNERVTCSLQKAFNGYRRH